MIYDPEIHTKVKCQACHKNYSTKENYKRFNGGFWCDQCVEKAKKEIIEKNRKGV